MKRIASILILLHLTIICFGQAGAIAKGVGKTFAKKAAKETVEAASEAATKKIAKETSEEIAEQYAKKVAREKLMEQIEKKGYRYFHSVRNRPFSESEYTPNNRASERSYRVEPFFRRL